MEANSGVGSSTGRLYFLAARLFLAIALLSILAPGIAGAVARSPRTTPSREARVAIVNVDVQPVQITVDGQITTARLPSGRSLSLLLEPREYVFGVGPVGQVSSNARSAMLIDLGPSELATFDATTIALTLRTREVQPRALALTTPLRPLSGPDLPTPRGVSLLSVLVAILGLAAAGAFVVSQLSIERERVLDERASARMQQMASQSLNSLPPLSMDLAARTRRF